jgi:arabinogalactan endo-1,4-beta-galactosidase
LKRAGLSWVFVDFHYSYYYDDGSKQDIPDADLILMLTS